MTRLVGERLRDIRAAIVVTEAHVGGSLAKPTIDTELVLHAVLFNLMVIGETVKNVDDELRSQAPDVPWRDYAGLRDVISHQYFRVQRDIIVDTVRGDLPQLRATVEKLLDRRLTATRGRARPAGRGRRGHRARRSGAARARGAPP